MLRLTVILLICCRGTIGPGSAVLAAEEYLLTPDTVSQVYRTGEADPAIFNIPEDVQRLLDFNPRIGMKGLVDFFLEQYRDEYRLVKCFHDWITEEIVYDPEFDDTSAWKNGREKIPPSVIILEQKRAGHRGFARLFSEMCTLAEVEAVTIHGISNRNLGPDLRPSEHSWNGVKIRGVWYLVDTARDARNRKVRGGGVETGLYSHKELFLKPEAKILINFPEDDRYQFLEEKVSKEDFLSGPLLELDSARYGVVYAGPRQQAENGGSGLTAAAEPEDGGSRYLRRNQAALTGGRASFLFSVPEDVRFQVRLTDGEGTRFPRYAFTHREENRNICTFSLPGPGEYIAEVYGLENGELSGWKHLFSCVVAGQEKGPTLPVPGLFFKTYGWKWSGLEAVSSRIGFSTGGRYVSLTLRAPRDIEVEATVETAGGKDVESWVFTDYPDEGQVTFTIVPEERGKFYTTLRVKREGDSGKEASGGSFSAMEFAFVNLAVPGSEDFPVHELFFRKPFLEQGFRFISDNLMHAADEGYYRVTVAAPEGFFMDGEMSAADTNIEFTYEKEGNVYSFYFLPGIESTRKGKLFRIDRSGGKELLAEIILPRFSSFRPSVHEPGWIYKKNGFERAGIILLEENIHRAGEPGYAYCALEVPLGIDLFAEYILLNGENVSRSHVVAGTPSAKEKRFYFRLPDQGPGIVTLYVQNFAAEEAGGPAAPVEVLEFALFPTGFARKIPPPGEVIYYRDFFRKGFAHVRDNLAGTEAERFEITIKAPSLYSLTCRISTEDGEELRDRCSYRVRGEEYTFIIDIPPEEARWRVDISAADEQGAVTDLCWFLLDHVPNGRL